jgi:hypothetical protein
VNDAATEARLRGGDEGRHSAKTPQGSGALVPVSALLVATSALIAAASTACGPPPAPRAMQPAVPQRLSLSPRIVGDNHPGRSVVVPAFLREASPPPGAWLRLEFRDPQHPTGVVIDFLEECPEIEQRAVPCGGTRACVMSWRQGQELLAGRAALSMGEHVYWWPASPGTCAQVAYSLGPGPYAEALERFVLDLADHVRPPPLRSPRPASMPAPQSAPEHQ